MRSQVSVKKRQVEDITLTLPRDVALGVCEAIAVAGDGGIDPFESPMRAELNSLAHRIEEIINKEEA
jgi:hypothetical protein